MTDPFSTPAPGSAPAQPYGTTPPPPPYGAPLYGAPLPQKGGNGLAVAGLVLGIGGIVTLGAFFIPSLLAVIFGFIGRSRAKRAQARHGGLALGAVITGLLGIILGIAFWVGIALFMQSGTFHRYDDCMTLAGNNQQAKDACSKMLSHDIFGTQNG